MATMLIDDKNISSAWARAFSQLASRGIEEIAPLQVVVTDLKDEGSLEIPAVRKALDDSLKAKGKPSVHTVSSTIFPKSYWNRDLPRTQLYSRYLGVLPDLRKSSPANRYGMYFERLIAYGSGPRKLNQLEQIIRAYKKGVHRRSALQAAIFDPAQDLTDQPQRGFPCLQQVSFNPDSSVGELGITGFYAMQYMYEKAYGNYLGLYHLGQFVAHELGLKLTQVTCIAAVAQLGVISKTECRQLIESMGQSL